MSEHQIARHPERIFADLLPKPKPAPVTPETPLTTVIAHMTAAHADAVPVLEASGEFIGAVTHISALTALLGGAQPSAAVQQLEQELEEDHALLAQRAERLGALHGASLRLLSLLAIHDVEQPLLQGAIEALADLVHARYGAIGLLDDAGALKQFIHTGVSAEEAARIGRWPEGKGLLGVVINEDHALRVEDLSKDPRSVGFPPQHPPMKNLLAVPISQEGQVYGRVYLCDKTDHTPFADEDEKIAAHFADALALTLAYHRARAERNQAEARSHAFIEAIPDLLFRIRGDGTYLDYKPAQDFPTLVPPSEFLGKKILDVLPRDVAEESMRLIRRVFETATVQTQAYQLPVNGEARDYEARIAPSGEDEVIVMVRDVTERRRAEQQMLLFSSVVVQTADSVMITDHNAIIQYVNQAFEQITGFSNAEAVGKKPNIVKSGQHDADFYRRLWDTIERGQAFRAIFTNRRKDGTLYYEEKTITPIKDPEGRISHFVSTGKDITARMQAEQENQRTQHFLNSVVENLPNMLFVKEAKELKFVRFNRAAEDLLGYSREDMIGKSDYDFFPKSEADFFTANDRKVLSSGTWQEIPEEPIHTKHKGTRTLHTKKIPILDETGQPLYLLGISEDITDRKKTEDTVLRLGRILDKSSNEIYVFNAETLRFVQVNHGAQLNLGYSMEELMDMTALDLKPEFNLKSFNELIDPLRHGRLDTLTFVTTHKRKDGSLYPVEVRLQFFPQESPPLFVAIIQDITERRRTEERLNYLAHYDTLTGLPNRVLLQDRLNIATSEADRNNRLVSVMLLDLDRFKIINDTLGHDAGDALLMAVAERLKVCLRAGDTIARIGGDEFTLVLANVAHVDDVARVAQKVMDQFIAPFRIGGRELFISPSVGISLYPHDDKKIENLLKNADAAMYHAKDLGRNNFQFFTAELNVRAAKRLTLETALRQALERNEFLLHYQPQVNLKTGRITGMEALLRWQHADMGLISPMDFIPLAEETGLIEPIGEWVLREACAQTQAWHRAGFGRLQVAVNLSGRQFMQKNLLERIKEILKETGLTPRYLELELTEGILMHNIEGVLAVLNALKGHGVSFSLDDFGTGYSSLSYLKRFPIDTLKIDQSFVRGIPADPDDAAIAQAIIAMAHSLELKVIAEGVETVKQLDFLRANKCDGMQGYYFSKPVPAAAMAQLLQEDRRLTVRRAAAKPRAKKRK
ncbi:MAG: EAL domain-containing protein [Sulfuricaulis sp.]|nr:EAL domain-containing protein [Sulfuricaulis sp.]